MKYLNSFLLALILFSAPVYSQLILKNTKFYGPKVVKNPYHFDQKSSKGENFGLSQVLELEQGISDDSKFNLLPDWKTYNSFNSEWNNETGIEITNPNSNTYNIYYQKFALRNNKFQNVKFNVSSNSPFQIHKNNDLVLENLEITDSLTDYSKSIDLIKGDHVFVLKIISSPKSSNNIKFRLSLGDSSVSALEILRDSEKLRPDLASLVHLPEIKSAELSFDGEYILVTYTMETPPEGKSDSWFELRKTKNYELIRSYRAISEQSNVKWRNDKLQFSFQKKHGDKNEIWIQDINGESRKILSTDKDLSDYQWSNDGSFIIYSISDKVERKKDEISLLDGMASRVPGYYNFKYLFKLNIASGDIQQLTYGKKETSLSDISNDDNYIIFITSQEDYTKEPYNYSTYWRMNLKTFEYDSLFSAFWGGEALFLQNENELLVIGGPSLFGSIGENVDEGQIANGYDNQAYTFNLESNEIKSISYDFNPAISSAYIAPETDKIFFTVTDADRSAAYSYSIEDKTYNKLFNGPDVCRELCFSKDFKTAYAIGSNAQGPKALYKIDLRKDDMQLVDDPSKKILDKKEFGDLKDWSFKNSNGDNIDGRYYLPPGFNPEKKYPLIVYYYGGTVPVGRSFAGRYPYNWYASQGYVVYVLQPRGCTGYGQKFSATHVNNWGKTTADDIIEGTQKFSAEHSFIDTSAIGCIGASYGGFMTMYLITQTDIFSAAVAHAGISSLSSYWGEGFWGYSYSAVASSGSFPWNRKDIYVDQSPLFQADKVNTPLLLTHGTSDTNVPPGESYQFYTALKLLNKDVEFLQVPEQNHWVLDYKKYFKWKYSIIAWFDKHLKQDSSWWENLYDE